MSQIWGPLYLQTAVITDTHGRTSVGVITIASDKTIQIAKDIKLQRTSLITGAGKDIKNYLPGDEKEYLNILGTRLFYDETGAPAIVSYGIASYMPNSSQDYINDQLKNNAKEAASSLANAQIAELINGHMTVKNETQSGEEIRNYLEREVKADSNTIEKNVTDIINIQNKYAKVSATASLQGIAPIKTWRYTSETGQKYEGAVRLWKYSTLNAIKNFNDPTRQNNQQKTDYKSSMGVSRPVNSDADF